MRLARRTLSTRVDDDGMLVLRARLTPEVGAVVLRAVEAALEQVPPAAEGDEASSAQRRADALGLVAESALAGGLDPGSPGDRFQVTVHVEAETLCCREAGQRTRRTLPRKRAIDPAAPQPAAPAADAAGGPGCRSSPRSVSTSRRQRTAAAQRPRHPASGPDAGQAVIEQAGGIHVGMEAARRVACDAGLVVLRHAPDGGVLDVGRRTRTVPTALRRALEGRDRNQCQFPGCNSRHCDAHHVVHWADGGATQLAEPGSRNAECGIMRSGWGVTADRMGFEQV